MASRADSESSNAPAIDDYGVIGNCRAAALASRQGSIDWLCLPRFDSPSIFAALLDSERGGRFRVAARGDFRTDRRYLPNTNVLETIFHTPDGSFVVRDCMPVASEAESRAILTPDHEILREIEGLAGEPEIEVCYDPRPDYARSSAYLVQRGALGLWCDMDGAALILRSDVPLQVAPDRHSARGTTRIRAGERIYLSLTYTADTPAIVPPLGATARSKLEQTVRWWRGWADVCAFDGPYREAVIRSALALKLMTYAPSGAIIAAPTTSLPERIGGDLNWDYRYCWLRDASLTVRALLSLSYEAEGAAFVHWLLHATRLTSPRLQVLYDVFGESRIIEQELPHLAGFGGSRPVRIGNAAASQTQLDVYGEVIDAVARLAGQNGRFDRDTTRLLNGLGQTVCERWRDPDDGIWEGRGDRAHHTHTKVLCWVALDSLIALRERGLARVDADRLRAERDAIRAAIETRGYNERLASYTSTFDSDDVDASLLTLPLYGYIEATHPRMRSTFNRITARLANGSLIYRHDGSNPMLPSGEGAFGICSFWAVECRARAGDVAGATLAFEQLLGYANDLGLFAEEIDPATGAALGNFPQAFTHIGLINAAVTLAKCQQRQQAEADTTRLTHGPQ